MFLRTPSPGPSATTHIELNTPRRSALLLLDEGITKHSDRFPKLQELSANDRADLLDIPRRTARRWRSQKELRRSGAKRSGRTSVLSPEVLDVVESWIEDNGYPGRTSHWQDIVDDLELQCSSDTLRRRCGQRGLHKYRAA